MMHAARRIANSTAFLQSLAICAMVIIASVIFYAH